jgi:hypothetical protein
VTRNSTLDLNAQAWPMRGDIQLFGNATLDLGFDLTMATPAGETATLHVNSGATEGLFPLPAVPAVVRGARFTLGDFETNGVAAISLDESDEVLRIESEFLASSGARFVNAGTIHFAGEAAIGNDTVFITSGIGRIVNDFGGTLVLGGNLDADTPLTNDGMLHIVGESNAGTAQIDSFTQSATGTLAINIENVIPGDFDALIVEGNAFLDGMLAVTLQNNFEPILGNSFTILETVFGNISGQFDFENVPVFNGLTLEVIYTSTTVELEVVAAGLPGDYNDDGSVDAADYVMWRKNEGTTNSLPNDPIGGMIDADQYNQWRAHFGETAVGSGAFSNTTVPEPASALLLILGSAIGCRKTTLTCLARSKTRHA